MYKKQYIIVAGEKSETLGSRKNESKSLPFSP